MNCPQVLWFWRITMIAYYLLASRVGVSPGCVNHKLYLWWLCHQGSSRVWAHHPRQSLKGFSYWNKHHIYLFSMPCILKVGGYGSCHKEIMRTSSLRTWENPKECQKQLMQEASQKQGDGGAKRQDRERKAWWSSVSESSFTLFSVINQ